MKQDAAVKPPATTARKNDRLLDFMMNTLLRTVDAQRP
jgi:hypothetical protein